jgi:hypothetical protein
MAHTDSQPQTFVEMVLVLLEDRFPWLGTDESAAGADVVEELNDLHTALQKTRAAAQRKQANQAR